MPLWKNKALNLTEQDIRYAMLNSQSNRSAALFIGCAYSTYRVYAKRYIDKESGLTLWDLHKNKAGKGITKHFDQPNNPAFRKTPIFEILEGKHPTYNRKRLQERIIEEGLMEEKCSCCEFDERRITDYRVPLVLIWKDGDKTNHRFENLQFVCFNCYFLQYEDFQPKSAIVKFTVKK